MTLTKEMILELSVGRSLTDDQAATAAGVTAKAYARQRRVFGIQSARSRPGVPRIGIGDQLSKELLEALYYGEGLSQSEIASKLGVSRWAVRYAMSERYGLLTRDKKTAWTHKIANMKARGERFHTYKDGRWRDQNGYIRIMTPENYPFTRRKHAKYIFEHILVWEMAHGNEVPEGYAIHHLNGIRDDNRIDNLGIVSHREHGKLGPTLRKILQERIISLEAEIARLKRGSD